MNQNSNQDTVTGKLNQAILYGFMFCPSPLEVINYLFSKLNGLPLPWEVFIEFDVDNIDPDQLTYDWCEYVGERKGYFFAPGKNRNSRRDTPSGYWKLDEEKVPVYDSGRKVVGFIDKLSFYCEDTETSWKMTEYRCNLGGNDKVEEKYIVCEVEFEIMEETFDWREQDDSEEEDNDDE